MANIDISKLERNEATRPIYTAAGISVWDEREALSENETLLYAIHDVRPDTDIQDVAAAKQFLGTLESDKAQAIQKKADNMFRTARLLTEGRDAKLPKKDWTMETVTIPASEYQKAYFENSALSVDDLQKKVVQDQTSLRLKQYQRETSQEIDEKVGGKINGAEGPAIGTMAGTGVGLIAAVVALSFGAPLVVATGISVGGFVFFSGIGFVNTGLDPLKEIPTQFGIHFFD